MEKEEYEEIKDVLKDYKVDNDGIWLSWSDLWRIDGVAVRNALKAINEDIENIETFWTFIGWRMLIEDLAALVRPGDNDDRTDNE